MSDHSPASLPTFSATPFRPDGGCPMSGLMMLGLAGPLAGLLLGLVAGVVSQWFYLILLFPLAIGVGVGGVSAFAVTAGKVRLPIICGLAGFLSGCLAVVSMHFYDYYTFEKSLAEVPSEVRMVAANFDKLQAKRAELPKELQELVDNLGQEPQVREALAVTGFRSHLDLMARRGVEISSKRGRNPINLGYVGSYIYWGVEAFIIAAIALACTYGVATEPFCSECETWKTGAVAGHFEAEAEPVRAALESGDLPALAELKPGESGNITLTLLRCPKCGNAAPIEAKLSSTTINKKGETSTTTLCTTTYPGEAATAFESLFSAKSEENQDDANPSESA